MRRFLLAVAVFFFVTTISVQAATFKAGEEYTLSEAARVDENLYLVGGNLLVSGLVDGDLVSGSGRLLVNGKVIDDVLAGGGQVDVLGSVSGDLRVIGGQVVVGGSVLGDVAVAGGSVNLAEGSVVGGDLIVAGGKVKVNGLVEGQIRIYGGQVEIGGRLLSSVRISASEKITVTKEAVISGDFVYSAPEKAVIDDGATISGKVTFNRSSMQRLGIDVIAFFAEMAGLFILVKFLVVLTASLMIVIFFKKYSLRISRMVIKRFGVNFGVGVVTLLVKPIIILLLLATILGSGLAILGGVVYVFSILLAKVMMGVVVGALLSFWLAKKIEIDWHWTTFGVFALQLIDFVPVAGILVSFVVFLATLGAISYNAYEHVWLKR